MTFLPVGRYLASSPTMPTMAAHVVSRNFQHSILEKSQTVLAMTAAHGHHVLILVIGFMLTSIKNAVQKKIKRQLRESMAAAILFSWNYHYYDVIRMSIIDPTHNLLLGTTQHVVSVWKQKDILDLQKIQSIVDSFVTPSDVGRIPMKIVSGFSQFTADQWRNWTLLYSLASLKGTIPLEHYDCWLLFVQASHLLCQRSITKQQVNQADMLLLEFCNTFERLYCTENLNMNLHLHGMDI